MIRAGKITSGQDIFHKSNGNSPKAILRTQFIGIYNKVFLTFTACY